jgi:hypothetical protein
MSYKLHNPIKAFLPLVKANSAFRTMGTDCDDIHYTQSKVFRYSRYRSCNKHLDDFNQTVILLISYFFIYINPNKQSK